MQITKNTRNLEEKILKLQKLANLEIKYFHIFWGWSVLRCFKSSISSKGAKNPVDIGANLLFKKSASCFTLKKKGTSRGRSTVVPRGSKMIKKKPWCMWFLIVLSHFLCWIDGRGKRALSYIILFIFLPLTISLKLYVLVVLSVCLATGWFPSSSGCGCLSMIFSSPLFS